MDFFLCFLSSNHMFHQKKKNNHIMMVITSYTHYECKICLWPQAKMHRIKKRQKLFLFLNWSSISCGFIQHSSYTLCWSLCFKSAAFSINNNQKTWVVHQQLSQLLKLLHCHIIKHIHGYFWKPWNFSVAMNMRSKRQCLFIICG